MSDVAYTESTDTPTDLIHKHIDNPITGESEEAMIRASLPELKKPREETGQDSGFDDTGVNTRAEPHQWDGSNISETDTTREALKKATTQITDEKKRAAGREFLKGYGIEDDALAWQVADEAAALGKKPSELPMVKAFVADNAGNSHTPIQDTDRFLWQRDATGNLAEATRAKANYQEAEIAHLEEAARQAEWERLQGTQGAEPQPEASPQEMSATNQQTIETPQQPTAEPQVDPLSAERAALNQKWTEAAAHAAYAQLSADERQAADAVVKWDQWAAKDPILQDHAKFAAFQQRVARGDVTAAAKMQEYQRAFDARKAWAEKFGRLNQDRVTRQLALEQHQQRQARTAYSQAAEAADTEFKNWLAKEHPAYASGRGFAALKQAATEYIEQDLGLSKQDWKIHWDQTGFLRNVAAQKAIAAGAMMRLTQSGRKALADHRVPPVQGHSPGVYADSRSEEAEADIRSLQRQLENASGNKALRLSTALSRAMRRAGQL